MVTQERHILRLIPQMKEIAGIPCNDVDQAAEVFQTNLV